MKNKIQKLLTLGFVLSLSSVGFAQQSQQEQSISGLEAKEKLLSLLGSEAQLGSAGEGSPCEVQVMPGCGASYVQITYLNSGRRVEALFQESSEADGEVRVRETSEFFSMDIQENGLYGGNILIQTGSGKALVRILKSNDVAACQL